MAAPSAPAGAAPPKKLVARFGPAPADTLDEEGNYNVHYVGTLFLDAPPEGVDGEEFLDLVRAIWCAVKETGHGNILISEYTRLGLLDPQTGRPPVPIAGCGFSEVLGLQGRGAFEAEMEIGPQDLKMLFAVAAGDHAAIAVDYRKTGGRPGENTQAFVFQ